MPGLVQFTRKSKNRTEPCAAVLHKEKLYLTSERRKETVSILDVETALLTQDNGIMLAYRRQGTLKNKNLRVLSRIFRHQASKILLDSPVTDEYLFAHLSHEDQTVVLEWVNTLLYIKYKLLKERNPNTADKVIIYDSIKFTICKLSFRIWVNFSIATLSDNLMLQLGRFQISFCFLSCPNQDSLFSNIILMKNQGKSRSRQLGRKVIYSLFLTH